jgi:hypothetical protein
VVASLDSDQRHRRRRRHGSGAHWWIRRVLQLCDGEEGAEE